MTPHEAMFGTRPDLKNLPSHLNAAGNPKLPTNCRMALAADIALVSGIGIAQTNLLNPSTTAKMNLKPAVAA